MWEATIKYLSLDEKTSKERAVKEQYICENNTSFSDVEEMLFSKFGSYDDFSVEAIKRSKIQEVANVREDAEEKVFLATLVDVFLNDDGSEKEIKYTIAFYSKDMKTAHGYIENYVSQGYNLSITKIVESKFIDVLK